MSLNQSRVEKSEPHTRKSGRSGGPAHQRSSHSAGSGKGGAGGAGTFSALTSSSTSSSQSLNSHRSYRKSNGRGGQSRVKINAANPEVLNGGTQNGVLPHNHPVMASLPGSSGVASVGVTKQVNHPFPKGTQTPPRPPLSNSSIGSTGLASVAAQPDLLKGFPLQFGSISPGFMNELQIPVRTSSAPPKLDEQNRVQANHDAKPSHMSASTAAKQHQKHEELQQLHQAAHQQKQQPGQDLSSDFINVSETRISSQIKRDTTLQALLPHQASAPKSVVIPQLGASTPLPFAQIQASVQFSNPGSQVQSHIGSIQMPLPISVSNASQVQQQVFISSLQPHPLQTQTIIHPNQGLGYQTLQLGPPMSGLGVGVAPQFSQQASVNFSATRKTVKITHPETREELTLDKRADSIVGSSSSAQTVQTARSHAAVAHPSQQPVPSYASPHQIGYYPAISSNSYATSIFYPGQAAHPSNNVQIAPGSSAPRYNFPTISGQMKLEEAIAPAASVRVTMKPPKTLVSERVGNSSSTFLHSVSKGTAVAQDEPVKPSRRHDESVSSHFPRGTEGVRLISSAMGEIFAQLSSTTVSSLVPGDGRLDSHVQQKKSVIGEASVSNSLHDTVKHSAPVVAGVQGQSTSAALANSVILSEEQVDHVTEPQEQNWDPLKKSDSFKGQQTLDKKEQHHLEPENQLAACDSAGNHKHFTAMSLELDDTSPRHDTNEMGSVQVPSDRVPTASSFLLSSSASGVSSSEVADASRKDPKILSAALGNFAVDLEEVAEEPKITKSGSSVACKKNVVGIEDKGLRKPLRSLDSELEKAVSENLIVTSSENKEDHIYALQGPDGTLQLVAEKSSITDYCEAENQEYESMHYSSCSISSSEMDASQRVMLVGKVDETVTPNTSNHLEIEQEKNEGKSANSNPLCSDEATGFGNITNEQGLLHSSIISLGTCLYSHESGKMFSASHSILDMCGNKFEGEGSICDGETYSHKAGEVSSASYSPLDTFRKITEGGGGICDRESAHAEPGVLNQGLAADELQVSSEMGQKHEIKGTDSMNSTVSSFLQISKAPSEQSKLKNISGKKKKKRKELLSKADAAGTTSDLYMAYKTPEQKQEAAMLDIVVTNAGTGGMLLYSGKMDEIISAKEEDTQRKSELDDWEEAAEISGPNLAASGRSEEKHNNKHHEKHDSELLGRKRYTRDFLMTFSEHYKELPPGFEIGADIADYILSSIYVNVSSVVNCEAPQLGGGRVFDRQPSGSRLEHRGSSLVEEDGWGKTAVPFVSARIDLAYGVAGGGRASQGGTLGVLKNPRGQPIGQYVSGVLSGPMQSPASPGGFSRLGADADRWQRATSVQKGLILPHTAKVVMHKAEKRYEVGKVSDEEEAKQRQLKAILNKLTPQNFEKLFTQVKEVDIDNVMTLRGVISQIFDKALMEPTFCEMYADFCFHLAGALPDMVVDNEKITFKRLLLNKCQEEFERGEREQAEADKNEEQGAAKQTDAEREEQRLKSRRRMLGNIRLIGELYKKKMLTERIMHECIKKLLGQFDDPDEEDLEALCKLMSTIGAIIDHPIAKEHMDAYFDRMQKLSANQQISARVRFMLRDAIDLRRNKWQQRRKVEGPKKIEEVRRDAAQERQAQSGRTARSSSMGSLVRRGQTIDYGSRLPSLLSSPGGQQISAVRGMPISSHSFVSQEARMDDKYIFENRTLSVPLSQKSVNNEPITLGPQGGLGKVMSVRGQSVRSSGFMNDIATDPGDNRRIVLGPNGFSSRGETVSKGLLQYRPASMHAYDQSNLQHRMGKDSRNNHYSSDRSTVALHATEHIQSPPTEAHDSSEKVSDEQLREKSISAIKEFYSANDKEEVARCVKELNAPYFYPTMVSLWVTDSFERKDRERDQLAKLLTFLYKSRNNFLSQVQIIKGFEFVFATLVDAICDAPKAAEFLGVVLAKIVLEKIVTLADVARLIREGGEEPGCLMETGIASDVLGSIFEVIKKEKGADVLNEMHKRSNIRVEDFLPLDSKKQAKFIPSI